MTTREDDHAALMAECRRLHQEVDRLTQRQVTPETIERVAELHSTIREQREEIERLRAENATLRAENATLLESGCKPEYQVGPRSDCRPDERDMV